MVLFVLLLSMILSVCIILSKNIIQSILYLILLFLLSSILFIYLGADFLGLMILIVYIGAISVLFLFVVMMLNIRILEVLSSFHIYLPIIVFIGCMFISYFLSFIFVYFRIFFFENLLSYNNWNLFTTLKLRALGELLFNESYFYFFIAALLLFVALLGAIILTLEKNYRQHIISYRFSDKIINWSLK